MGPLIPSAVLRAGGGGAACVCAILPVGAISRDLAVRGVIKFTAGTGQARPEDVFGRSLCAWLEASGRQGLPRKETAAGSAGGGPRGLQKVNSNLAISSSKTGNQPAGSVSWLLLAQPSEQTMKVRGRHRGFLKSSLGVSRTGI